MPADDIAWPPGKNSVKRESAKRIWSVLVFQVSPLEFTSDSSAKAKQLECLF